MIPAQQIEQGDVCLSADGSTFLYVVVEVGKERHHNPDLEAEVTYIATDCRHPDGQMRKHYWLATDQAPLVRGVPVITVPA